MPTASAVLRGGAFGTIERIPWPVYRTAVSNPTGEVSRPHISVHRRSATMTLLITRGFLVEDSPLVMETDSLRDPGGGACRMTGY
jgi:hypothetical protein